MTAGAPPEPHRDARASVLGAEDAAAFDALVVPRYLTFFGQLAAGMLLPFTPAAVAHVACRTGYPDVLLAERLPGLALSGVDASPAALEVARRRAEAAGLAGAAYVEAPEVPSPLPEGSFTHAIALHPAGGPRERAALFAELRRLLLPGGQALLALPLRGSFVEAADLLRELALHEDLNELSGALDAAAAARPTPETIAGELEAAGLVEIDVDVQLVAVSFENGGAFLADPVFRLVVVPDLATLLPAPAALQDRCVAYLNEAISKYWADSAFELTVNVGCASGRRP